MTSNSQTAAGSGHDALPDKQSEIMRKAIRLEWISIAIVAAVITMVGLVMGQSQAMRVAWVEDILALLPPIAFLVATRVIRRGPSRDHPYGHHRAIGVGHLVSAVALFAMGALLLVDSAIGLLMVDKPPIGMTVLFGHAIWAGWPMVAAMLVAVPPMVVLGRMKLKLSEELHDKVLFADADMLKADWMTGLATVVGVLGIGMGLWWADAAAAIAVSASIVKDGVTNVRAAVTGLTDARAKTHDDKGPHPLTVEVEEKAREVPWVKEARARVRDEGHVFHVEMFVVPLLGMDPTPAQIVELRTTLEDLDWKVHDVVVAVVDELRPEQVPAD
ncbi:cation transporter [Tessaracoccus oleiagri]|uniref:Divalent metal cation (Fe/Co/Zn/Cd) transporter n=1 Tax=Tessaracoccus oleiagri TaxID=686624 RepID=A0A1G9JBP7_9ACTN|nr:cation transporter [Tessaracoccus oleiagri]SDL34712.1 Divalent metal cation (Fe/Co/Zn/Cd) transporter [Tessaracoccus oleiagri]